MSVNLVPGGKSEIEVRPSAVEGENHAPDGDVTEREGALRPEYVAVLGQAQDEGDVRGEVSSNLVVSLSTTARWIAFAQAEYPSGDDALDVVGAFDPGQLAPAQHVVDVRLHLAEGEAHLVRVELARGTAPAPARRPSAGAARQASAIVAQRSLVVGDQLVAARVQAVERQLVARQHQRVGRDLLPSARCSERSRGRADRLPGRRPTR